MRCQGCQKPLLRCVVCSYYMNFDPPRSAITSETGKLLLVLGFKFILLFKNFKIKCLMRLFFVLFVIMEDI
jgi:hypothetical protein